MVASAPRVGSFPPLIDVGCTMLVLGSMPGIASLDASQYYAHPRNAFWPIMASVFGFERDAPYAERCAALLRARVALWDVLRECERHGSLDSAIVDATSKVNDFPRLFARYPNVHTVVFNGAKSADTFKRRVPQTVATDARKFVRMPSTSPAHASLKLADKLEKWREVMDPARI
jgi:double-stranded uracil-DNA glycosylase